MGLYQALANSDWKAAAPNLAKAADPTLRHLGAMEAQQPQQAQALAEGWASYAQKQPRWLAAALKQRVLELYEKARQGRSEQDLVVIDKKISELAMELAQGNLGRMDHWQVSSGRWRMTQDGQIRGEGSSTLQFKHPLPGECYLEFTLTVLHGLRPRIYFGVGGVYIGNEDFDRLMGLNQANAGPYIPQSYEVGRPMRVGLWWKGKELRWYVDGELIAIGQRRRVHASVPLLLSAGDDYSAGAILVGDFKLLPEPPQEIQSPKALPLALAVPAKSASRPAQTAPATTQAKSLWGPQAPLMAEGTDEQVAVADRIVYGEYLKNGQRNPKWDDRLRRYLHQTWLERKNDVRSVSRERLVIEGRRLYMDGCREPVFISTLARNLELTGNASGALGLAEQAMVGLHKRPEAAYMRMWSAHRMWSLQRNAAQKKKNEHYLDEMIEAIAQMVQQKLFGPTEQELLVCDVALLLTSGDSQLPEPCQKRLVEKLQSLPQASEVLKNTAAGYYHFNVAWNFRGTGWASTVTEEGWKGYREHLALARRHLVQAWQDDPKIPYAASKMINVCTGSPEGRTWVARSMAARFDYAPPYLNHNFYLMPRWGGTHEAMYNFGVGCMKTNRYDTCVPLILVQETLPRISTDMQLDFSFWQRPGVYENVKTIINRYLAQSTTRFHSYNRAALMGYAIRTQHWDDAAALLAAGNLDEKGLELASLSLPQAQEMVLAHSGAWGADVAAGEALMAKRQWDSAKTLLEKVFPTVPKGPAARHVRSLLLQCRWMEQFDAGKQVALDLEEDLPGWRWRKGYWQSDGRGGVVGASDRRHQLQIWSEADFGTAFEIEGYLEMRGGGDHLTGGLGFGELLHCPAVCEIDAMQNQVLLGYVIVDDSTAKKVPLREKTHLRVQRLGHKMNVWVNGKQFFENQIVPGASSVGHNGHICLTETYIGSDRIMRFSELKIRKLASPTDD